MIKAIIWDMGGVLISEEVASRARWEKRLGLTPEELTHIVFYHPLAEKLVVGQTSFMSMWNDIGTKLKLSEEETRQLSEDFWGEPVWNLDLMDYIASLRGHYKLGVLSDAWVTTRATVDERINYALFDAILFSAEEGMRKPDPRYYQRILSQLEINADEAIFVDDRTVNIEGAEAVGMHGVHYTKDIDIRQRIDQIIETASSNLQHRQ